jgi:hypothetical protein
MTIKQGVQGVRFVPGLEPMMGPPTGIMERSARARGLALTVGVALPAAECAAAAEHAQRLEAHGLAHLWLGLDPAVDRVAACQAAAEAAAAAPRLRVLAGADGAMRDVRDPEGAGGWLTGGRDVAVSAARAGRCWLATDCDPADVLRGVLAAEEEAGGLPVGGVGVLLRAGMRRGDLVAGQRGATNATALRVLVERYIAVGASSFVLRPVATDFRHWLHDRCVPLTNLEEEGRAPCGC